MLGRALSNGNLAGATARARSLINTHGVVRIALQRGTSILFDVGDLTAIAPFYQGLQSSARASLGRLWLSTTTAAAYARQVRSLTKLDVVMTENGSVLASTLPSVPLASLPTSGSGNVTVNGVEYRAFTHPATGFGGSQVQITLLADLAPIQMSAADSRLVAGALIGIFFVVAVFFAFLVSRSLQMQIEGFLEAARRLGSGDFSAQVPIVGHDEFAELGQEFNKMSHQLEERLQEIRDQRGRLEDAMRRIGETFASNLDRDGLLEIMLNTAVDGVGAAGGRAAMRATSGRVEERVRVGVLDGHDNVLAAVEARVLESGAPSGVEIDGVDALGHPLTASQDQQEVLGVLSVARTDRAFTPVERDLFHYLAAQAAVSIENVELHERVQRQAVTDELTGLFNHRRFHEAISTEVERSRRFGQHIGLIMLDIDDFKRVNDTFGHQQGDVVLREVAKIMQGFSREIDAPARYGGEELALLLPGTNLEGAYHLAERLRMGIESLTVHTDNGADDLRVTASLGVASVVPGPDIEPSDLIAAADAALYEAKRAGKNKTTRAE